ncbi:MAG: hypothetical protein AAF772_00110 [Acidobacteriota bacterium]
MIDAAVPLDARAFVGAALVPLVMGLLALPIAAVLHRLRRPGVAAPPAGETLLILGAGQVVTTALVVQTLGLVGWLRVKPFLAAVALVAALAVAAGGWAVVRMPFEMLRAGLRPWLASARGSAAVLPLVALAGLLLLACRAAFVNGTDSLARHGPMIVQWLQDDRIAISTRWNYPLLWEQQFVVPLVLVGRDTLVVVPRLLSVVLLMLAVREIGRALGLPARRARAAAWLVALTPLIWGLTGEGSLKGDVVFAVGVLLGLRALATLRARPAPAALGLRVLLPGTLALLLLLGSKATGVAYGALLAGLMTLGLLLLRRWRSRRDGRADAPPPSRDARATIDAAALLTLIALLCASMALPQLRALVEHGNPVYPITVQLGERVLLMGRGDVGGTALLDHVGDAATWNAWLQGAFRRLGPSVFLLVLGLAGALRLAIHGPRSPRGAVTARALALASLLLFLLYLRTPWTRGLTPDQLAVAMSGFGLRFALAPLTLFALCAVAAWPRGAAAGWRVAGALLAAISAALPWIVAARWLPQPIAPDPLPGAAALGVVVHGAAALLLAFAIQRALRRRHPRGGAPTAPTAWGRALAAPIALLIVVAGVLMAYGDQVERRRPQAWLDERAAMWQFAWTEVPAFTTIATAGTHTLGRYVLYGPRFSHRLHAVGQNPSDGHLDPVPPGIHWLYLSFRPRVAEMGVNRGGVLHRLRGRGWRVARQGGRPPAYLLRRRVAKAPRPAVAAAPEAIQ